jgi:tetratricopeptide (TPR) repeat protein
VNFAPYVFAMMAASGCGPELNQASALLQAGRPGPAAGILESASARCPSSAQVFDLLGIANDLLGNTEPAQQAFRKAIAIEPAAARPRVNLAVSLFRIGKEEEGLAELQKAISLEPRNTLANANLGAYHARRGEWDRALAYFDAAGGDASPVIRNDPQFRLALIKCLLGTGRRQRAVAMLPSPRDQQPSPFRFSVGVTLAEHGLYGPAIEQFLAIPEPDRDAAVQFNIGFAHSRQAQFDTARRYYFAAIDADASHVESYFRVALDFVAQGETSKAIPWLWRARRMAPQRGDMAATLAEQLISGHYFQSAAAVLDAAVAGGARDALLEVAQGDLAMEQGRAPEAVARYQKALDLNPGAGPACAGLARALVAQERQAEAERLLSEFLARRPADEAVNAQFGRMQAEQGNCARAVPMLERASQAGLFSPGLATDLARCYRRVNRPADAVVLLEPLRSRLAGNRAYHYELAQAYTTLKRVADARSELAEVQRIDKSDHQGLRFTPPAVYIH